jgi:hypothetical protein
MLAQSRSHAHATRKDSAPRAAEVRSFRRPRRRQLTVGDLIAEVYGATGSSYETVRVLSAPSPIAARLDCRFLFE